MIERILLAVDGSTDSEKAIPFAAEIAGRFGSEVLVVHVHETMFGLAGPLAGPFEAETIEEATDLTDRVVRTLKDQGLSARGETPSCEYPHTGVEIVEAARAEDADLIVMGSRGLSGLARVLMGSVTRKVLHLAGRPVLVVR